jgi:hypothetical protein
MICNIPIELKDQAKNPSFHPQKSRINDAALFVYMGQEKNHSNFPHTN